MTNISLPDGLTCIKNNTFGDCISLTSITIPNNVTSIDNVAFFDCNSFTNITLSDNLTCIGAGAFSCCDNLLNIIVDENNNTYMSIDENTLIQYAVDKKDTSFIIPNNVKVIGLWAFLVPKIY